MLGRCGRRRSERGKWQLKGQGWGDIIVETRERIMGGKEKSSHV